MKLYHERANLLKVLAHPVRLQILDELRGDAECICHLSPLLNKPQVYLSEVPHRWAAMSCLSSCPPWGRASPPGRKDLANVETIKVDMAVPSPAAGEVIAVNEALADAPELINQDPYGTGWLVELKPCAWPAPGFIDAEAYLALMTAQAEETAQ